MKNQFAKTITAFIIFFSVSGLQAQLATAQGSDELYVTSAYQEGAAIYQNNGKKGLVNNYGYMITGAIYDNIQLFINGYAAVEKDGKWTFVNKQGNRLTPHRYHWVGKFQFGLAPVNENGKWGILNEQGFEVFNTVYEAVEILNEHQFRLKKGGIWSLIELNQATTSSIL